MGVDAPGGGGGRKLGLPRQLGRGRQQVGHLELAQHGVTALTQMGQVQATLIVLEPLVQTGKGQLLGARLGPSISGLE